MRKKLIITGILLSVFVLLGANWQSMFRQRNIWTGKQVFQGTTLQLRDGSALQLATVNITSADSAYDRTRNQAANERYVTYDPERHGTILNIKTGTVGQTSTRVDLPAITAKMDGLISGFRWVSGSADVALNIKANANDYIESTLGTATAGSDVSNDTAGDLKVWQADFIPGGTNVWRIVFAHQT